MQCHLQNLVGVVQMAFAIVIILAERGIIYNPAGINSDSFLRDGGHRAEREEWAPVGLWEASAVALRGTVWNRPKRLTEPKAASLFSSISQHWWCGDCISFPWLLYQITANWVGLKQQKFIFLQLWRLESLKSESCQAMLPQKAHGQDPCLF